MEKYRDQYRIPSARNPNWNYANAGAYFITICTQHREHFFGDIINQEMQLSQAGTIAYQCWTEIPRHFSFVELGNFVVMPNHVHGVLVLGNSLKEETDSKGGVTGKNNPMTKDSVSKIIRWYKGICTFRIKKDQPDFGWQSRFHDHIIRDEKSFDNIQNYIASNPLNWEKDKFHSR